MTCQLLLNRCTRQFQDVVVFALMILNSCLLLAAEPEDVVFMAKIDGSEQRYVQVRPEQFPPEAVDVLLVLHGHGRDRWQFVREEFPAARAVRDFANDHQMLLISPDYRAKTSWMGPLAEADMLQILDELRAKFPVRRFFLTGGSMGGSSSLTLAALHPQHFAGVAAMNGTANHLLYENYQEAISASFGGSPAEKFDEYKRRSAEYWPERFTMPLAMTTGGLDRAVPPDSCQRLSAALVRMGRSPLHLHRPEGGHSTTYEDAKQILDFVYNAASAKQHDKK